MRRIAVAVLTVMLVTSSSALADVEAVRDPNDRSGRFDIKTLRHSHGSDGERVRHTVRLHRSWRSRALGRNHYTIGIYFDVGRLNLPGRSYRWRALLTSDLICPASPCGSDDRAPDRGMIRHVL